MEQFKSAVHPVAQTDARDWRFLVRARHLVACALGAGYLCKLTIERAGQTDNPAPDTRFGPFGNRSSLESLKRLGNGHVIVIITI